MYIDELPDQSEVDLLNSRFGNFHFNENKEEVSEYKLYHEDFIKIGHFVVDRFDHLIPEPFNEYLLQKNLKEKFKNDLIDHLIINSLLIESMNSDIIESNHEFCSVFADLCNEGYETLIYGKEISGYNRDLNKVSNYLRYKEVTKVHVKNKHKSQSYNIPIALFPITFFLAFNYEFHNNFVSNNISNINTIENHVEMFKDIFPQYEEQINRKGQANLSSFESKLFEREANDTIILINHILFEQEFNLSLVAEIATKMEGLNKKVSNDYLLQKIKKTLALNCLLPNVISRVNYLDIVEWCLFENKRDNYNNVTFQLLPLVYLQLAFIVIPLMEKLFCLLVQEGIALVNTDNIEFNANLPKGLDIKQFYSTNKLIQHTKKVTESICLKSLISDYDDNLNFDSTDSEFKEDAQQRTIQSRIAFQEQIDSIDFGKWLDELGF